MSRAGVGDSRVRGGSPSWAPELSSREMEVCTLTTSHEGKSLERMERRPSIVIVDYENEEII